MAFQRSYSKVWWGNSLDNSLYHDRNEFQSLDTFIKQPEYLPKIDKSKESSISWNNDNSPESLKSQDSGFLDNDDIKKVKLSSTKFNTSQNSISTIETPPTVIRRKKDIPSSFEDYRISFSVPSSPLSLMRNYGFIGKIDRINLSNSKVEADLDYNNDFIRKCKNINRKCRRNILMQSSEFLNTDTELGNYNLKTDVSNDNDDNNNVENQMENKMILSSLKSNNETSDFATNISIPNNKSTKLSSYSGFSESLPYHFDYTYTDLNCDKLPVQYWLNDIRTSYCQEIMSTLQTKSISQEAFRNLKITATIVSKIIRQLQTRSMILQGEFERVEKILHRKVNGNLVEAIFNTEDLIESVDNFIHVVQRRSIFFADSKKDCKNFEEIIDYLKLLMKDLKISLEKHHYLDFQSLTDDIQVLKRYILITLRVIFEKLIKILIVNIKNSKCDLLLRANLNMVATLSNMDYNGFASLNHAFAKNETVKVLLLICLDNKLSSVRALALRALTTICSSVESIKQMSEAGGIEIIKDILSCEIINKFRTEPEKREAISLLTQVTAPWHGYEYIIPGLKDCAGNIVEYLTDIIAKTQCCQTLLLCAASLNNMSRLEVTSLYSMMSNNTILTLKEAVENRGPGISIFLCEQIVSIVLNMSTNKKCHSHLQNEQILDFLIFMFRSKFDEKFTTRSEREAHHRTIKTIFRVLELFILESVIAQEVFKHKFLSIFLKLQEDSNEYSTQLHDIILLNQRRNESLLQKSFNKSSPIPISGSVKSRLKINPNRYESYV